MKRFTNAGRTALDAGNFYSGLSLALTLPDICGSIEDPGPGKSQKRYVKWCDDWIVPKYTLKIGTDKKEKVFLSAADLFQLRCSLIHSGSAEFDPSKATTVQRIEFFDDTVGSHLNLMTVNGTPFLQLKVKPFCNDIFDSVDDWDSAKGADPTIQAEKQKLLVIRTSGFAIDGVQFGSPRT